ncbi:MAG: nucleoside-diphosphate kinase [Ignavibacteria bacterium]|nr:nucleoside-diphosphate kinase [Ignavibacteria bacterium]
MEKTLAIIKPDAVGKNVIGDIVSRIEKAGFRILAMKLTRLSKEQAEAFYEIHRGKAFFEDLVKYMTSGNIVAMALEKENAIDDFRKLIGATDPAKAEEGTIRKLYGTNIEKNAIHGSDSMENGVREVLFFFSSGEIVQNS